MRGAVVTAPGELRVVGDLPLPKIGEYDALVRILCCATCNGTDAKLLAGHLPARFPAVLGHESVGRVVRVGPGVRSFQVGDLVLRPSAVYPGDQAGPYFSAWGGYAEWGRVTDIAAAAADGRPPTALNRYCRYQQRVPAGMDPAAASMLVTLKEVKSWLNRAGVGQKTRLLVIGDGPVAAAFVRLAAVTGAAVVATLGHRDRRLERLRGLGAHAALNTRALAPEAIAGALDRAGASPFDVVIDTVVQPELFDALRPLLTPGARLTVYGTPQPRLSAQSVAAYQIPFDEAETHAEVLSLVESGRLELLAFYEAVVPLEAVNEALDRVQRRQVDGKVVVTMGEEETACEKPL